MGFLIILIVLYLMYRYIAGGDKKEQNAKKDDNPANALLEEVPETVLRMADHKDAIRIICKDGKADEYHFDWFIHSLEMDHEIEDVYLLASMERGFPYLCETRNEFEWLDLIVRKFPGWMEYIVVLAGKYTPWGDGTHPEKLEYWRQYIQEQANAGNLEAQGVLCGAPAENGRIFSEEEVASFKNRYLQTLMTLAEEGSAEAQLVVGKYIAPDYSKESEAWLRKAADQGMSDAYHLLLRVLQHRVDKEKNLMEIRKTGEISDEDRAYFKKMEAEALDYLCKGANSDKGAYVGVFQGKLGACYAFGETGNLIGLYGIKTGDVYLEKNLEKAKYWCERALKNGCEEAKDVIATINKELSEAKA